MTYEKYGKYDYIIAGAGAAGCVIAARLATNPPLRVNGIAGLRVADPSIMPRITSANTYAPTVMIGEFLSRLITGK